MPRATRSDIDGLVQEARAIELLADDIEVPLDRMQDYWATAADLISLVTDIEELRARVPNASYEDPALFVLKHRLREITSRLTELGRD